ncbi:MAG: type 4a pilus biogenesis protein PilO [Candidatus Omnitrophica bacterium]|nr:type 4a pilus biogenesis protein PilO [Candidatus Omnitrophota bacterium]MDD5078931.1 type 4a pilus biogenesis protein PilO [Candidatus Omnitrophota bacterium]
MSTDALMKKAQGNILNLAIVGVCIFVAFNIYRGKEGELNLLKEERDNEVKKNEILQGINKLQNNIRIIKDDVNNKAISEVISKLGNIARETQVKITFIKPQNEVFPSGGGYIKYPFELSITTNSYHKMGKFISRIEKSPEIYNIDDLSIVSNPKAVEDKISARISVSTILIKD